MRPRRILNLIMAVGEDMVEEDMDIEPELRQANPTVPQRRSRMM